MEVKITTLQSKLCESFCQDVKIIDRDGQYIIETPFMFADGDHYQIYLEQHPMGGFKIHDGGNTLMRLSYEMDIQRLEKGARQELFQTIKSEFGLTENIGELSLDCIANDLGVSVMRYGQAITKIHDIKFLNRVRVQNTFYEDLQDEIKRIVQPHSRIHQDYIFSEIDEHGDYPIDYKIDTSNPNDNFFIFAVGSKEKAHLVNITLERLLRLKSEKNYQYKPLTVLKDHSELPQKTINRLMNIGGEFIDSPQPADLERKIKQIAA